MGKVVGIDLGTTFSAVAHVDEHGQPEIIPNAENDRMTPSVVMFEEGPRHRWENRQTERQGSPRTNCRIRQARDGKIKRDVFPGPLMIRTIHPKNSLR